MVTIRSATIDDLQSLRDLNEQIFVDNFKYDDDIILNFASTPRGEAYFKEAIKNKNGCFFIAEENGEKIGYVNGEKKDIFYRKSRYFEINDMGVIPKKRGRGIGKSLLQVIADWAKKNDYQRIYINCYAKNKKALRFYQRNGYSEIDICLEKKIR